MAKLTRRICILFRRNSYINQPCARNRMIARLSSSFLVAALSRLGIENTVLKNRVKIEAIVLSDLDHDCPSHTATTRFEGC